MKIGLNAYIWTLSDMNKTDFQNFHFQGGLPYTSVLTMDPHMRLSGIISNSPKDLTFWLTSYIWTIYNINQ